jgi:VWFA-related protein
MRPTLAAVVLCACAFAQAIPGRPTELSVAFLQKPGQYRTDLVKDDLRIAEDGSPQQVLDLQPAASQPRCIALLVDNSGSNRDKFSKGATGRLEGAAGAALDWIHQTFPGPGNRAMVVNFNDHVYLDQRLTDSVPLIDAAVHKVDMRGGTAFYDALIKTSDALATEAGPDCRRVIVALTDAVDNSSKAGQGEAVGAVRRAHATLYVVGLRDRHPVDIVRKLAESTGGLYFSAANPKDLRTAFTSLELDLNSRFRLTYASLSAQNRRVALKVQLWDSTRKKLSKLQVLAPEFREVPSVPR